MANTITYPRRRKFIICIDRFDTLGGRVWAVCVDGSWKMAKRVNVQVPMTTVFKGLNARQPIAYLTGYCRRIQLDPESDTITLSGSK